VYQVGINKGIILRCTAYQISRLILPVLCTATTITHKHHQMHKTDIFIYTIPLHEFCYKCEMRDLLIKASNYFHSYSSAEYKSAAFIN